MMMRSIRLSAAAMLLAAAAAGCQKPIFFPTSSLAEAAKEANAFAAYDTNADGRADFFLFADSAGRIDRIGYDNNADGAIDEVIPLDALAFDQCRHLVIILDGFGYDVVRAHYDAGGLRLMHPPSRLIAPYPSMTDLAMEDALGYIPCRGFEAMYFDRRANRVVGGSLAYLAGANEPYNRLLQYRAGLIWDAIGYLYPASVFGKELNDAKRVFDQGGQQEFLAYFVSSAGIGTRQGAEGQRLALRQVDQFIHQVLWQSRGLTKVTVLSDHGHTYTPAMRVNLDKELAARGWRLTESLRGPRDVVYIRFGLVTYASLCSLRPAELAADVAGCEGVQLASYADVGAVVVLGPQGQRGVVRRVADRYGYQADQGDPLKLKDILAGMKAGADGTYAEDDLLAATATHVYPDPLQRLWRAHFALAQNVPDVIVSLEGNRYSGTASFAGAVNVASTHGGLDRANSTAVIMSSVGALPAVLRSADVPGAMARLLGRPWPLGK